MIRNRNNTVHVMPVILVFGLLAFGFACCTVATVIGMRDAVSQSEYATAEYRTISEVKSKDLESSLAREQELSKTIVVLKEHLTNLMTAYTKIAAPIAASAVAASECPPDPFTKMEILLRTKRAD